MPSINKAVSFMLLSIMACSGSLANVEPSRLLQDKSKTITPSVLPQKNLPGLPGAGEVPKVSQGPDFIDLSNYTKAVTQFDGVLADETVNYLRLKAD